MGCRFIELPEKYGALPLGGDGRGMGWAEDAFCLLDGLLMEWNRLGKVSP